MNGLDVGEATYMTLQNNAMTDDNDFVAFKPGANLLSVPISCNELHRISVGSLGSLEGSTDTVSVSKGRTKGPNS